MAFSSQNQNNLTDDELKFGYWFITHKSILKRILTIALIVISAPFYVFSLYHSIDYFFVRGVGERQALRELTTGVDYTKLHEAFSPKDLIVGSPLVFGGLRDRYDFIVPIENKNIDFRVTFSFQFLGPGFEAQKFSGFILPGENKYLMIFGLPSASRPRVLRAELSDIKWQRISKHDIQDPASYVAERTNFSISNIVYSPAVTRDNVIVNRAKFTVINNTAFSFWRVDFPVILMRGAIPQAVNIVTADEFRSGEARNLEVSWFEALPLVDRVEVKASVNIFDPSVYMK